MHNTSKTLTYYANLPVGAKGGSVGSPAPPPSSPFVIHAPATDGSPLPNYYAQAMQVMDEISDQFVWQLVPANHDVARWLLEESVVGPYRDRRLTMEQVCQLLGFGTRMHVDVFLQQHEIYDYTVEDFDKDTATLDRFAGLAGRRSLRTKRRRLYIDGPQIL